MKARQALLNDNRTCSLYNVTMATGLSSEDKNWEERLAVLEHQLACLKEGLTTDSLGNDLADASEERIVKEIEITRRRLELSERGE